VTEETAMDCDAFRDDLMDVLYGEADDAARRRFDAHAAACAACRRELPELRRLRGDLRAWTVPPQLVGPSRRFGRPALFSWPGLAAAAGLVIALGAALGLSRAELRYDDRGVSLRFGTGADAQAALAAHETDHRREIEALKAALAAEPRGADEPVLQRVQAMIDASESRQATLFDAQLKDFRRETETRRRYDLARVSAGLAYIDGKTGLQSARTNQLVGQILRASQEK
jgi:hypothetical protein